MTRLDSNSGPADQESQIQSGPEQNIDKKAQRFRGPLAFSATMEDVC
jgi:hypothetical protein